MKISAREKKITSHTFNCPAGLFGLHLSLHTDDVKLFKNGY